MTDRRSRPLWRGALRLWPGLLAVLVLTVGCDRAKGAKQDGATAAAAPGRRGRGGATHRADHPRLHGAHRRDPHRRGAGAGRRRARAGAVQGGHRGQAGPDPVRDPARRVRGGARVGARPARQGAGRSHEGPGHLRRGSRACAAGRAQAPSWARRSRTSTGTARSPRRGRFRSRTWIPRCAQEKVAMANVEAADAALRDSQLVQRTQIQLAEAGGAVREGRP